MFPEEGSPYTIMSSPHQIDGESQLIALRIKAKKYFDQVKPPSEYAQKI